MRWDELSSRLLVFTCLFASILSLKTLFLFHFRPPSEMPFQVTYKVATRYSDELLLGMGLDINSAPKEVLSLLPGIGMGLAGRIESWREKHGPFQDVRGLMEVSGIGEKRLGAILPFIRSGVGRNDFMRQKIHYQILESQNDTDDPREE